MAHMDKHNEVHVIVSDDPKTRGLRRELKFVRDNIRVAVEQLIHLRRQRVMYQMVLRRELGTKARPDQEEFGEGWKGRCTEKNYLKFELVDLVDVLKDVDPKFHFDSEFLPSNLSTSMDRLLTQEQMDGFAKIYENYNVCSGREAEVPETIGSYLAMKADYEAKLLQNNAMIAEIKSIRGKLEDLQLQAKEDKSFMKFLISYKPRLINRGGDDFEQSIQTLRSPPEYTDFDYTVDNLNNDKYRKMWQDNLKEREMIGNCISQLNERLNAATSRIMQAERLCLLNQVECQHTEFGPLDPRRDLQPKNNPEDGTSRKQVIAFQVQYKKGQLEVTVNENHHLLDFLATLVLSKERDFSKLHRSLNETAGKYRSVLEGEWMKLRDIQKLKLEKEQQKREKDTKSSKKKKK